MKKKLLSILLSLAMVVTMMPMATMTAFAATGSGTKDDPWQIGASTPTDVTAYLDGSTLHIEGTGAMMDFVDENGRPWHSSVNSITTVKIGPNVTKLGAFAFSSCYNVANLYIDSIESWYGITYGNANSNPFCVSGSSSMHLYVGNTDKTELVIPNTLTAIPDYAFKNWNMLTRVTIPAGVTSIGKEAFSACKALESVTLPDGLTTIGQNAFQNCRELPSINLPDSLTTIGQFAFDGCLELQSINLPDSLTDIGSGAFKTCKELDSITIPRKLSEINAETFSGCNDLDSVHLPAGLTMIGGSAFSQCQELETLIIPQNVTSIGAFATYSTQDLKTVVVKATTPPTLGLYNFDFKSEGRIYVPYGYDATYKAAWTDHQSKIYGGYLVWLNTFDNGDVTASRECFPTEEYNGLSDASKTVTLTVKPDKGYALKSLKYNDGEADHDITKDPTSGKYQFTMPAKNVTVTAEFAPTYGIISEVQGHGSVTTKIGDANVTEAAEGVGVVFTATADEGYQFKEWVDVRGNANLSSTTTNPITITMPAAEIKIKAVFEAIPPVGDTVTVQTNGHGTATATNVGGTVTLTPDPESGYGLKEWQVISGDLLASDIVDNQFTMPAGNVTIKAIFAPLYTVTAEVDGHGASAEASVASAVEGTKVTLTATAQEGYELDTWEVVSGGVTVENDGTDDYFTMPAANVKVKAIFKAIEPGSYGIITEAQGHGNVTATVGGETVTSAAKNANVVLTAVAEEGYQFKEWVDVRGNANLSSATTNPITITMPAAEIKVKAVFEEKIDEGNKVTIIGGKHGSVVVSTDGKPITSGGKVPKGTQVTVKAKPHFGYYLKKLNVQDDTCKPVKVIKNTFTMPDKDVTITATFSPVVIPIPIIDPTPGQTDKEKFESYKLAQKTECDKLITITDSEAVKVLVADAKTAIDNTKYDSKKSLNENKAVVDSIVAELKVNIETVRADEATTALVKAAKVKLTKTTALKNGKIKLSFKGLTLKDGKKVTSYQIYRKVKGGEYKRVATVTRTKSSNTYTNAKSLKKGKKYYYKVRGRVQLSSGKYVYTKWSNVKSAKCMKTVK